MTTEGNHVDNTSRPAYGFGLLRSSESNLDPIIDGGLEETTDVIEDDEDGTEDTHRFFLYTGTVAHLVNKSTPAGPDESTERTSSLCGIKPFWPGIWFGAVEHDRLKADSLPLCNRCTNVKGAHSSGRA